MRLSDELVLIKLDDLYLICNEIEFIYNSMYTHLRIGWRGFVFLFLKIKFKNFV